MQYVCVNMNVFVPARNLGFVVTCTDVEQLPYRGVKKKKKKVFVNTYYANLDKSV